ncbi:MAG TPA: hypothetical protein VL418_10730, partial [Devosiaceae bacterium]|nr:hypothetical protein [Devosiaceae bacterium]
MSTFARLAVAAVFCALPLAPALAAGPKLSPVGSWQSDDGQARVRVTLCGDGTQLCAHLVGLSGGARTPKNLRLLNSYVVQGAQRADDNVWEGMVRFN